MAIFIGVECAGMRHSVAVAADSEGNLLSSTRLYEGLAFHTTERKELQSRLFLMLKNLAHGMNKTVRELHDIILCIGLSGVTFPFDRETDLHDELVGLFEGFPGLIRKIICTGDAEIVFASHAQQDTGAAVICHCGSTAYIANPKIRGPHEGHFRFGGWGPAFGDEGSGYWMGRTALRVIAEEYDRGIPAEDSFLWLRTDQWLSEPDSTVYEWRIGSLLWQEIKQDFSGSVFDERTALFSFAHRLRVEGFDLWRKVASGLTIPLFHVYQEEESRKTQDGPAHRIISQAVSHLARQFLEACKTVNVFGNEGPIVFYGGILKYHEEFRTLLEREIVRSLQCSVRFISPNTAGTMRPVCGALLFALGNSSTNALKLPDKYVIDHLYKGHSRLDLHGDLEND